MMKQFVTFKLANEVYGVPIIQVQEIIQRTTTTRLPQMPDFVEGVINLRGKIVPVIDLRKRFKIPLSEDDAKVRIIVTQIGNRSVGMVVDAVRGVTNFEESTIEPVPESIRSVEKAYLDGVGKQQDGIIILLNLDKVLSESEG